MSKDHPATPQGLPTTTWDAPRTSQTSPGSPKDPSGNIQGPPCDATRTLNGSPGMHQRPPRLSRDRHGTMRTLKCRTDLTRDVHEAILRPEKHGFPAGRATLDVSQPSTCFFENYFSTIEDEKPLLQFHLLNARQKQQFQKSEDHNNRKSLYMKRLHTHFRHGK